MNNPTTSVILSTAYLAPIQYYTKLISYREVFIDYHENYLKQSYRNRTVILTANGPLHLSLPVVDGPGAKGPIRELKLSYDHQWQQIHWRGIASAYNNSPFFEYYCDDLAPFYHLKKWKYLIDFNMELQDTILKAMDTECNIRFTSEYFVQGNIPEGMDDFRYTIHPKPHRQSPDPDFMPLPYMQVFQDKSGFFPNPGIPDLLFNEGPESVSYLKSCISTGIPR